MLKSVSPRRFWFLNLSVAILFILIAYQLYQLSVIRQSSLLEVARKQHHLTITIPPFRGAILDRTGKELATNLKVPSIYAVPRVLSEAQKSDLASKLEPILNLKKEYLAERLNRDKAFVWIKRMVTEQEAEAVQSLKHLALGLTEEYKRFYPQGDLLSHVLGFTNIDNEGLEGVEKFRNKELQGRAGKRYTRRDALGREIKALEVKTIPPLHGRRIFLTIDQYLQYLTERALERAVKERKAKAGTAIVMDPHTGQILALANRPTFNSNHAKESLAEERRNRAITDVYEPGSVFKIVAASAALQERVTDLTQTFFCENGAYRYGSKTLRDVHAYGDLSFEEVVIKSSNIGTVKIAALMKPKVFYGYIKDYGIGKLTGIDLPGEVSGFVRPPSEWSKTSPYNIPMGHEVLVTALQMVRAFAVIANGGHLVRPYIVAQIQDQAGIVLHEVEPVIERDVLGEDTAKKMREILRRVVDEGTGKNAKIDGIPVAGKTGTAQKVLPDGRGYSHSNFVASFVGFAPAAEPFLVMGVVLDDPKPLYYGGTVAAPVFREVIEAGILYLGYIPENAKTFTGVSGPIAQERQPIAPQRSN